MNTEKENQLIAALDSPKPTVQVSAIVELSKFTTESRVIQKIRQLSQSPDRQVAYFAAQAISRIQGRVGNLPVIEFTGESLTREHLACAPATAVPRILEYLRRHAKDLAEEVRPAAAEFLQKHGAAPDADFLAQWLESTHSMLALPIMGALEKLAPKSLVPALPHLLSSEFPMVRAQAVLTLKRIDPGEALAHVAEMLGSSRAEDRVAGLSACFLFEFREVEPLILALLRSEADEDVLKAARMLFETNPDMDSALRLLDLLESMPREQRDPLAIIFKKVCDSLPLTGTVSAEEATPGAVATRWKKERLRKFLRNLEVQITASDQKKLGGIEAWLQKNLAHPEVAEFVEKLSLNPATEDLYRRLTATTEADRALILNWDDPKSQSPVVRRRMLEKLDAAKFSQVAGWVREEAAQGIDPIRVAALNALRHCSGHPDDLALAEAALHHGNPQVVMAGIRILEKYHPTRLRAFLPEFLKSPDSLIRLKAIQMGLQTNVQQGIEVLLPMLDSPDTAERARALGSLALVPFESVRVKLLDALQKETNPEVAGRLITIMLTNPSQELLGELDRMKTPANPEISLLVSQARTRLFEIVLHSFEETLSDAGGIEPALSDLGGPVGKPLQGLPEELPDLDAEPSPPPTHPAAPSPVGPKTAPAPGRGPSSIPPGKRPEKSGESPVTAKPVANPFFAKANQPRVSAEKKMGVDKVISGSNSLLFNFMVKLGLARAEDNKDLSLPKPDPKNVAGTPAQPAKPYAVGEVRNSIRIREIQQKLSPVEKR